MRFVLAFLLLPMFAVAEVVPQTTYVQNGSFIVSKIVNGVETVVANNIATDHKAKEMAGNEAIKCKCTTKISQPSFTVKIKYVTVADNTQAYRIVFEWAAPTVRANGSSLAASDIKEYVLSYKEQNGTVTTIVVPSTLTKYTTPILPKGSYTGNLTTVDVKGFSSIAPATVTVNI